MKIIKLIILISIMAACSSMDFKKTVDYLDVNKFMGDWYVHVGRFTFLERNAYNSLERYTWNQEKNRIDIDFTFNKDGFDGPKKSIPQKAWIHNKKTNAHWKVSPFWPIKLDYLVVALAEDYSWTAIGVPSGKYLWIMSREKTFRHDQEKVVINKLKEIGYPVDDLEYIKHQ